MPENVSIPIPETPGSALQRMFLDCLFKDDELLPRDKRPKNYVPEGAVLVEGLKGRIAFHPERIEAKRVELKAIIDSIVPSQFFKAQQGGGWSIMALCNDRQGNQWAEQRGVERLVTLAIGLGFCEYMAERAFWRTMPGGLPYVIFDTSPKKPKRTGKRGSK